MNLQPVDGLDAPPRARWPRWRRAIIAAAVAVLAAGAFLLWGPVGLGAGPLYVGELDSAGAKHYSTTDPTMSRPARARTRLARSAPR